LFEPHISYCNVIWCNTYPSHLNKLISLQKKIIRAISWSWYNTPTRPLFHRLGLLRLTELNIYHNACIMHQVVNVTNSRLSQLIPISSPLHAHATRNKHLITGKTRRLKCANLSITSRGPKIWNELDGRLKVLKSVSIFKKTLKKELLRLYL
jgi:hypothetical protein